MRVPALAMRLRGLGLHLGFLQDGNAEVPLHDLAAHEEVGDDVDIGAEREVLVDGLDAGRLGFGRRGEVPFAPSK